MKFELYDTVMLKDGRQGTIVDVLGNDFVVDIVTDGDYDTALIPLSEIIQKIA